MCVQGEGQSLLGGQKEIDTIRALFHDLRGPVAAIMLLSTSPKGDVDRKLHAICEQAQWLAELVDSSLDDAADDSLQLVEVAKIAREVAARSQSACTTTITVRPSDVGDPERGVWAWARPVALGRALGCLVDNAVRAAGPTGHVVVELAECGTALHLTVRDDGPGLGRIGHRTSLGLTTVRAMVAACNGTFHLSPGDGGGAVAEIALPVRHIHLAVS
jgi:K+-sensing histidine kinase KdpD